MDWWTGGWTFELISGWMDAGMDAEIDHHILKDLSIQTNGVTPFVFSKHLQYFSAGENQSCKVVNNSLSPRSFKILVKEGWLGKIDRDSRDTQPWESHRYSWNWSSGYHYQSKVRRTAGSLKLRFKELWLNGWRNAPRNSVFHHEISRAINTQVPTSVVESWMFKTFNVGRI